MRSIKILTAAAAISFAAPASANMITFETAPPGLFSGPVAEDGFTYALARGGLFVNSIGNPGQDMEGDIILGSGLLLVRSLDGGLFTFGRVDAGAFDEFRIGAHSVVIAGYRKGQFIGSEEYQISSTDVRSPTLDNWTREYATPRGLRGKPIDNLLMLLDGATERSTYFSAMDNVVLTPFIPEPATLLLFGAGLLGFAASRQSGHASLSGGGEHHRAIPTRRR